MPRDFFAERGINPNEDSPKRAPRDFFAERGINPNEESDKGSSATDTFKMLNDIISGGLRQGVAGIGDSVVNLPAQAVNTVLPEKYRLQLFKSGHGPSYNLGKGIGDIAGFMMGGSALDSARAASEALPYIGRLAESLGGGGLSGVGRRAIGSGLYGVTQNPDEKLKGGIEGAAISAILDSLIGGASKLLPSNQLRGNLSPTELFKNQQAAEGTNTPLGDIVGSPGLKKAYETVIANVPFSGADTTSAAIRDQLNERGSGLLDEMINNVSEQELKKEVGGALDKSYKEAMKLKREHYLNLDDLADQYDLKIETPNFQSTAKEIFETIKESPLLMDEMDKSFLKKLKKYSTPIKKEKEKSTDVYSQVSDDFLAKLEEYLNPSDEEGIKIPRPNKEEKIKTRNIFKGILGGKARKSYKDSNDYEGGIYHQLKDALETDVNTAFESTEDPELKKKYDEAQNFYRKNIAPFDDPTLKTFIRKGGDTDLIIASFLKGGKNDRANLLSKLMSKLPEEKRNLVPAAYFSGALDKSGNFSAREMKKMYDKLGPNQKEVLLEGGMKNRMDMLSRLVGMNDHAINRMANPKTGVQAVVPLINKAIIAAGAGGGAVAGGPAGAIIGSMLTPAVAGTGANLLNRWFTSPKARDSMINAIINGSKNERKINNVGQLLKPLLIDAFSSQ